MLRNQKSQLWQKQSLFLLPVFFKSIAKGHQRLSCASSVAYLFPIGQFKSQVHYKKKAVLLEI